jgi:Raf kinase inhibitor-like YbhB/YbcL family protein
MARSFYGLEPSKLQTKKGQKNIETKGHVQVPREYQILFSLSSPSETRRKVLCCGYMRIYSPAFPEGGRIPSLYTCEGKNISPPLIIENPPSEAMSLVLIMEDPDVPKDIRPDGMWDHWIVFNMPPTTELIEEGKDPEGTLGRNTRGNLGYGGPCPPDREHRYYFKIFAIDTMLNLPEGTGKQEVLEAIQDHILAQATLMGKYEKGKGDTSQK